MEPKLQEWIHEAVIVEATKLLRSKLSGVSDLKQNFFQGTTRDYDNDLRVHLSGTRAVQIIDFNGQRKAPFTNISVSDVSCQIRTSLSEAARKQFEKKYDRRLPHRTVGAIFEIGGCCLLFKFNPEIKGVPQVTLSIDSLVLIGGEGSSNLGFPAPIEEIDDVRDLIARMKNTTPPQAASARSRYKCTSPIHSRAESPSGDEIGSPNGQLATQAPLASDIYDEHGKATKRPAPSPRALKAINLRGNQLLGLIGKNKKSNTSSSNLIGGIPESHRSISLSDNKRVATIEDGAGESNERKFLRLTGSGKDAIRMPVNEDKSSGSGTPIVHSKQGAPGENPRVHSQIANERGNHIGTPLVDPLPIIASRPEKEQPKPTRDSEASPRPTNTTFNSLQENPWGKLTRIPLKYVIIPKNQLVQLSSGASWVTSVADIESVHTNLPSGTPDSFMPSALKHVEDTADQNNTTPGPAVEARQSDTDKHSLSDGSPKGVETSSPRKNYHENQHTANPSDSVLRDTAFQTDPPVVLDADGADEDDVVSWAPTSRASSIVPSPGNESVPSITPAFPPPHSNTHSPQTANQFPIPSSSVSSPCAKLNTDSNVHLSSMLPSLSDSLNIKSDNGTGLTGGNESLANNVHSSIPHSEYDMEQRVPYAIGDVIQSSDDIYFSRIPVSTLAVPPTRSQRSPVQQIERTPYSRPQKEQPSFPETRFLGSPLEPKKSIPSPHSSVGSIILGTFNWDAGKDDDTPKNFSMHDELQQGHDKDRRTTDVMESSARNVAERSKRLSTPVLDLPPNLIEGGRERELCGASRTRSGSNQSEVKVRHSSRAKSTQHVESPVSVDAEMLSEPEKALGSLSQVYNILPSLPSITSPTSKKIAKSYITRRERKKRREESEMQFS